MGMNLFLTKLYTRLLEPLVGFSHLKMIKSSRTHVEVGRTLGQQRWEGRYKIQFQMPLWSACEYNKFSWIVTNRNKLIKSRYM